MPNPFLLVVFALLTVAGIAGLVIYLLRPAKEEIPPADALNDSRISGQWAGGDAPIHQHPAQQHNVIHHDFGGGHTLH